MRLINLCLFRGVFIRELAVLYSEMLKVMNYYVVLRINEWQLASVCGLLCAS